MTVPVGSFHFRGIGGFLLPHSPFEGLIGRHPSGDQRQVVPQEATHHERCNDQKDYDCHLHPHNLSFGITVMTVLGKRPST